MNGINQNWEDKMTENSNDFNERVEMLALALSLKEDGRVFDIRSNRLLLSTYIKMIERDQDSFFIEKEQKHKIIQSLENSLAVYDFHESESIQKMLEKLNNNDPTDFVLLPIFFLPGDYRKMIGHVCGLTVYKKNEEFIVLKVDKQRLFDGYTASYFEIPEKSSKELSNLMFLERDSWQKEPYYIFNELTKLSSSSKSIPIPAIKMKKQTTKNCGVTEIEASLRTILFNCRKDIFSLDKDIKVTPKWHSKHPAPTLEMRKRFVDAMEGENIEQNENLKYILHHYRYRKGELVENPAFGAILTSHGWYRTIRKHYSEDPYISIMLDNNGHIPDTYDKSQVKEKSKLIEPPGVLYNMSIQMVDTFELRWAQSQITYDIKLYKDRLPHINIKVAKEVTEYLVTQLEEKHQEIEVELQKRLEINRMSDKEEMKQKLNVKEEGGEVHAEKNIDTMTSEKQKDTTDEKGSCFQSLKEHAVIQATMKRKTSPYEDIRAVEKIEEISSGRCRVNKTGCFSFLRAWNPLLQKAKRPSSKLSMPEQESAKKVKFTALFQRLRLNETTGHTTSRQQPLSLSR